MNYNHIMDQVKTLANGNNEIVDNIEKYIQRLEEEKKSYLNQLLDTRHKLHEKDYTVENQKNVIENTRKALELCTEENKHLKGLVRLWA